MVSHLVKMAATGALLLTVSSSLAYADGHEVCGVDLTDAIPSGTIAGNVTSVGFIAGVRWGDGVLVLNDGEQRKFKLLGLKILETGVAENAFIGEVYNLKKVEDFEGNYFGASKKISIAKSKGDGVVNNGKCVVVKFRTSGGGVQLSGPAPVGASIEFID